MAISWAEIWESVEVIDAAEASGLRVFGLRWRVGSPLQYSTLDEAMTAGTLDVAEISEAGSVPRLRVSNKSDLMTLLLAGEQLVGAKQNRVLNVSLMVPAQEAIDVPVSCVEAGRWSYKSAKFQSGGSMSHGMLRRLMSRHTHRGYRQSGTPTSDQGRVWGEVSRKLCATGSASPSQALDQVYRDHRSNLDELVKKVPAPLDCQGVVFAIGGRIAGADLFDQSATLVKLWPKLIRAYALDVLESGPEPTGGAVAHEVVRDWIRGTSSASCEPYKSPGVGQDVRFESPAIAGSALVVGDQPVHVEFFPVSAGT
jgi:hypothetical protein